MGCCESKIPLHDIGQDSGYFCLSLYQPKMMALIHAPVRIRTALTNIISELGCSCKEKEWTDQVLYTFGWKINPFQVNSGAKSGTLGKMLILRFLEEAYAAGYEFVAGSDMARMLSQNALYFRKVPGDGDPRRRRVACIAPGGFDRLVLLHCDATIYSALLSSLQKSWPNGVQKEFDETSLGETLHNIKLSGNPWMSAGEDSTNSRLLMTSLVQTMASIKWRLVAAVNIKGGTDTLFFIEDPEYQLEHFSMLSLNRNDRIRLLGLEPGACAAVKTAITQFYMGVEPKEDTYHGAVQFKLQGYPFFCSGKEAVATRRLLCRIFETLYSCGWRIRSSLDISRKITDKSVFILVRCHPDPSIRFSCIALTDIGSLRLIDFPPAIRDRMKNVIMEAYDHGVAKEKLQDETCLKLELKGGPWQGTLYNAGLHGRSTVLQLMLELEGRQQGYRLECSADVSAKYVERRTTTVTSANPGQNRVGPGNTGQVRAQRTETKVERFKVDLDSWFFSHRSGGFAEGSNSEPAFAPPPPYQQQQFGFTDFSSYFQTEHSAAIRAAEAQQLGI